MRANASVIPAARRAGVAVMSVVAAAVIGTGLFSVYSARQQGKAGERAAGIQGAAADAGIAEQQRQFDAIQELLKHYVAVGEEGLSGQRALSGLAGPQAQQQAIDAIRNSPQFAAMQRQGETSILQNASATGGLRGGNVQAALGQFSPALLSGLIDQQYGRFGGMAQMGQNSAVMQGNAGMQTGGNIANLLQQQGAAAAGGALAQGRTQAGYANAITGAIGMYGGLGGFGGRTVTPNYTNAGYMVP